MPDDDHDNITDIQAHRLAKRARRSGTAGHGIAKPKQPKPKQADILVDIGREQAELFHSPDGTAWATVEIGGHQETWAVRATGFRRWLTHKYFQEEDSSPNSDAIAAALNVLDGIAHYRGDQHDVHLRCAALNGRIYLDLTDEAWRAIEVDSDGWRVIDEAPVRFRRAAGMLPLTVPKHGGHINDLRPFLNVATDGDFVLIVAFILAALRPRGPYPALVLGGEHGSAKSTVARVIRVLVDPSEVELRRLPREEHHLFIAASNAHLLVFDNLSSLTDWQSDALCVLATGGGFAARKLYTDGDEKLFNATRPTVLTGVTTPVTRSDLADRSIFLNMPRIPAGKRRLESEFWRDFEAARPQLFGALLTAVAHGLQELPAVRLSNAPRMADFAAWGVATETAYAEPGAFSAAYETARAEAINQTLEASPVATALRRFMTGKEEWDGLLKDLFEGLTVLVTKRRAEGKEWPQSERGLRNRLTEAAPFLRMVGITIAGEGKNKKGRTVWVRNQPSPPSPPSPAYGERHFWGDGTADGAQPEPSREPDNGDGDGAQFEPSPPPSPKKTSNINECGGGDGGDGHSRTQTAETSPHRCAQCGGASDGELTPTRNGNALVWLHAECARFWRSAPA
jgi:hypothetical protein